jgi:uncharacterized Rmd1/YagE family protein
MGHYDSDYEDTEREISKERLKYEMKAKRKTLGKLDKLLAQIDIANTVIDTPERFMWALEDYRRWLNEGLDEWERDHIVDILKAK